MRVFRVLLMLFSAISFHGHAGIQKIAEAVNTEMKSIVDQQYQQHAQIEQMQSQGAVGFPQVVLTPEFMAQQALDNVAATIEAGTLEGIEDQHEEDLSQLFWLQGYLDCLLPSYLQPVVERVYQGKERAIQARNNIAFMVSRFVNRIKSTLYIKRYVAE